MLCFNDVLSLFWPFFISYVRLLNQLLIDFDQQQFFFWSDACTFLFRLDLSLFLSQMIRKNGMRNYGTYTKYSNWMRFRLESTTKRRENKKTFVACAYRPFDDFDLTLSCWILFSTLCSSMVNELIKL